MKKESRILLIILIVVTLGIILYFTEESSIKVLKELKASDIEEITVSNVGYYTITHQEDIQILLDALKSMDNIRKIPEYKDGGLSIDLKLRTGDTMDISLRAKDIIINGQHYKCTEAYFNKIKEICNLLSEVYQVNPS